MQRRGAVRGARMQQVQPILSTCHSTSYRMSSANCAGGRVSSLSVTYKAFRGLPTEPMAAGTTSSRSYATVDRCTGDQCLDDTDIHPFQELNNVLSPTHPLPPPPVEYPAPEPRPDGDVWFALEDDLRYRVNTEVELFRANLQQVLRDGFTQLRPPVMLCHIPIDELNTLGASCFHGNTSHQPLPSFDCHPRMCSQELVSNGGSQAVELEVTSAESIHQQMDQYLIRCQTVTSVITNTLRRSEYH